MDWPAELETAHRELSELDWQFREFASRHPDGLRRAAFASLDQNHPLIDYRLQAWPTFLGRARARELARVSVGLYDLIRGIPERVFGNEPEWLSDYYGLGNPEYVREILQPPHGLEEAVGRGDFIATRSGLKCLEFNVTPNLGGLDASVITDLMLQVPLVQSFLQTHQVRIAEKDILHLFFRHIVRCVERAGLVDHGEVNIAVVATYLNRQQGKDLVAQRYLQEQYEATLERLGGGFRGSVLLVGHHDLKLEANRIHDGPTGLVLHGLMLTSVRFGTEGPLYQCFKQGGVQLFNGPASLLSNNKYTLAVLSEMSDSGIYSPEEARLIEDHVPWTRRLAARETTYHGQRVYLPDLLLAEQPQLILKRALSFGGKDVVLGPFVTAQAWREAVALALESGNWVAQEFAESLPYLFQAGEDGCSLHDANWGPFVFGREYAGAILRVQPKAMQDVINLTQTASEGILFEVIDE